MPTEAMAGSVGHRSLSSPLPDSHFGASPDLWGSVLRELVMEVSQCLHDSRRALHIGVVDHDVTWQQAKAISATVPPPGSLRATHCQPLPWTQGTLISEGPWAKPGTHWAQQGQSTVSIQGMNQPPRSFPYQTPLRGSAAPASGLLVWFRMWQSLHPSSSCSATAQTSREGLGLARRQYHPRLAPSQV